MDNLSEAVGIIEDILDNDGNTANKEKARNLFKAYKKKQIENAKKVLMEQKYPDKVGKCWKILNQFESADLANSKEDRIELGDCKRSDTNLEWCHGHKSV